MIRGLKVVVVMPSYNASKTLEWTYSEIPHHIVDEVILVDDKSNDNTVEVARKLGIKNMLVHDNNMGYGGNQKTCFNFALSLNADIIILLHPDYQYTPKLIGALCEMISTGIYDVVLASRILCGSALKGGMPIYKYIANRILTFFQNIILNQKISEYHTGYRAYRSKVLQTINYSLNSNDFIFDNEIISQIIINKFCVGEISCPAKYFPEASSIHFYQSIRYGIGIIRVSIEHFLHQTSIKKINRNLPK